MNVEMRRGVVLLSALALVLVLAACGANRQDYAARNRALLASVPVFPGAVKLHEASTPYVTPEGGMSDPSGYTMTAFYRLPSGTSGPAVLRFFAKRLHRRGWRSGRIAGNFTRDGALVGVNPFLGTVVGSTYEVLVDYRGAGRG